LIHEPPWQYPLIVAQWLRTGPRAMTALWHSASPDPIDRRLATLCVPVTVVRGTRDALCPADWARTLVGAAAFGRLVELPGAAHMTVQTHPDAMDTLLRAAAATPPWRRRHPRPALISPEATPCPSGPASRWSSATFDLARRMHPSVSTATRGCR
jgi:alpha-beta hydrolase superfamily lysophospholipase